MMKQKSPMMQQSCYLNMMYIFLSSTVLLYVLYFSFELIFYWEYHLFYQVRCNEEMPKNVRTSPCVWGWRTSKGQKQLLLFSFWESSPRQSHGSGFHGLYIFKKKKIASLEKIACSGCNLPTLRFWRVWGGWESAHGSRSVTQGLLQQVTMLC